ncbi:MAG: ComEC/Rec2 family competence protein [Acidobacteriota bacterium]
MSETTIPRTFSRHPLLWLAAWFALGIVLANLGDVSLYPSLAIASLLAIVCAVRPSAAPFLFPLIFLSIGMSCYDIENRSIAPNRIKRIYDDGRIHSREPVEIEGVVLGVPESGYDGTILLLSAEKLTFKDSELVVSGHVRLFIPVDQDVGASRFDQLGLGHGSRLRIFCRLEREERFQNPGVASMLEILDQKGIDATATVKSVLLIEKLGDESYFIPLAWVYEQRQRLIFEFREHLSDPAAGVMIASLLGDQHFLDRQTSEVFRDGGTFHVLVISGLHITFIGGLTLWIVSYWIRRPVLQFVLAAGFLWSYTLAVGAEVPVVRASIMFTALIFSRVVHRRASQLNAFGFCCLMLLVWRPGDIFSASFQLTVVSVAAIVGCSFPLIEKLRAIGRWMPTADQPLPPSVSKPLRRFCEFLYWNSAIWKIENSRQIWRANLFKSSHPAWLSATNLQSLISYVFEGLTVSIIVQVWMLPLLVIYFHRVSPVSVLLNLWVGLFLAIESFCAVFAVLIAGASDWLAAPLIWLTEISNQLMMWLPMWFSENRLASFRLPTYPGVLTSIYFSFGASVVIGAAQIFKWDPFELARKSCGRRRFIIATLLITAVLSLIIVSHPYSAPAPDGRLTFDFLDVGQGDSALVTFPNGATMLIDGGGLINYRGDEGEFEPDTRRIGESVVSEFLWEKGYSSIDYLVATHADADHIQGLGDVARNFNVGLVMVGAMAVEDRDFSEFIHVVESRKIAVTTVHRGDEFRIGGARVQILNPRTDSPADVSANNTSVVMKITYGDIRLLMTGDIERAVENELLLDPSYDIRTDVIKVPHHGSRTSSTEAFVNRVGAGTAVISVGRRSPFGHPHAEVVNRWQNRGADVLTTGEKGTITISTDGANAELHRFVP